MTIRELASQINARAWKADVGQSSYARYGGQFSIARAEVTKINGGLDDGLWITLKSGAQMIAFYDEVSL